MYTYMFWNQYIMIITKLAVILNVNKVSKLSILQTSCQKITKIFVETKLIYTTKKYLKQYVKYLISLVTKSVTYDVCTFLRQEPHLSQQEPGIEDIIHSLK